MGGLPPEARRGTRSDPLAHPRNDERRDGDRRDDREDHPEVRSRLEDADLEVHAHHASDQRAGKKEHGRERQHLHDLVRALPRAREEHVERADDRLARVTRRLNGLLEPIAQRARSARPSPSSRSPRAPGASARVRPRDARRAPGGGVPPPVAWRQALASTSSLTEASPDIALASISSRSCSSASKASR